MNRKLIAGILSGALIFTGGLAFNSAQAKPVQGEQQEIDNQQRDRSDFFEERMNDHAKRMAERYGISQAEIEEALKNHVHFEDIQVAAALSKISGKPFSEVLAMKTDWHQVAERLGVTTEQFDQYMENEMIEELAQNSKLDKKTVENLMHDNYAPHDITIAGLIANASGKNVKSVLSKRKVNNSWDDVAKEFNVDLQKIMKPNRPHRY